jgi:hypothetical protein
VLPSLAFKDPRPRRSGQAVKESMDDFLLEDEEVLAQVTSIFDSFNPRFPQAFHALMAAL